MRAHWSRRDFLRTSAAGAFALAGAPRLFAQTTEASVASTLAVAVGDNPVEITRRAIEAVGGIRAFVPPGSEVIVKPNIGWAHGPECASNTDPQVVGALVAMCLGEAQAASVLVADYACADPRRSYGLSGIGQAAQDAGAEVAFIRGGEFVEAEIGGEHLPAWPVHPRFAPAANRVMINVPVAKHHGLTRLTLGMKNLFGCIGGDRGQLHQRIHALLPDLTRHFRPALTVIDANRILLRNGPSGGDPNDVETRNTVIASADPVAADAFGTTIFDLDPADMAWIVNAHAAGLGQMDLDQVQIERIAI